MNQESLWYIGLKLCSVTRVQCMEKVTERRGTQVYGVEARRGSGVY